MVSDTDCSTPLDGLVVVEFCHFVAGPTCAMILSDLGATCIKVESPGGDALRHNGSMFGSVAANFHWSNRGKKSVALDLKSEEGQVVARDLIKSADVLVQNFAPGVMSRLGLGYEDAIALNPKLIYCSISGYGSALEAASRPGFDAIVQAESGIIDLTGHPDSPGARTGTPMVDLCTGFAASNAVLAALLRRGRTGAGEHVEVSLYDTAISLCGFPIMSYLADGRAPTRVGNASRDSVPNDTYAAKDGTIYVSCPSQSLFERFMRDVVGRPDLATDPRYLTNADRKENEEAYRVDLEAALAERTVAEWMERTDAARIPAGIVRTIPDVIGSEDFQRSGKLSWAKAADGADIPHLALPFTYSGSTLKGAAAAPEIGGDTTDVLCNHLGYDKVRVDGLVTSKVVHQYGIE